MSRARKPPAYLRYLKARLKPLGRPGFWASTVVLLLVLIGTGYYWQHPELLKTLINNQATDSDELTDDPNQLIDHPNLYSEELAAVMADIESSSVLLEEFDSIRALTTINQPNRKSEKKKQEGLFSQIISQQGKTNSKQKLASPILGSKTPKQENSANPFVQSTQELVNPGLVSAGNNLLNNSFGNGLVKNSQNPSQDSASFTGETITKPIFGLNSPNAIKSNQSETQVSPLPITATNSSTATNEAESSDNQEAQVSPQNSTYPFSDPGQTTSSPISVPSTPKFPRSRPRPITSTYSNPYTNSLPSQSYS